MFVAGLGVGPTFAVFTIVVQNAVPFHELGAATSDLTLFRQIGTTVGLTMAFTLFRNNLTWDLLRTEILGRGVPSALVPTAAPPGFDLGALTNPVGASSALDFLSKVPAQAQGLFLDGFHSAFTIAIANSMWLGVGATIAALGATLFLHEIPLRAHHGAAPAAAAGGEVRAGGPSPAVD
jgi:hypothetical protein